MYGTASPVTRWRQAHPRLIGAENDILLRTAKDLREVFGQRRASGGSRVRIASAQERVG